mmetsp:Transcript_40453/g.100040  ORF Transcript_40453/g.100040 Transcript_40453/m.100040 type:complete len:209 (-) Transcript_40453:537-1163(-)
MRTVPSKDELSTRLPSRLNATDVTPSVCARSNLRRHWPVCTLHTLILPSCDADASMSLSRLNSSASTASSCIISISSAWYLRSVLSFPETQSHTSMNPSTEPVASKSPSGEKRAHSGWLFLLNLMARCSVVGYVSSSSCLTGAAPRNRSKAVPGGSMPWCCCHFSDCPSRLSSRDGGTTDTSVANACAMAVRRFSLEVPSGYASRGSK